jgi:hypothetical protein
LKEKLISKDKANKVYDLLVQLGGAWEDDRWDFVYHHTESEYGCGEWRFGGKLGAGGKYRSSHNVVTCYREDETPQTKELMNELNTKLAQITN